jgi:hypothetical protein
MRFGKGSFSKYSTLETSTKDVVFLLIRKAVAYDFEMHEI